jgi:hypothetical protein
VHTRAQRVLCKFELNLSNPLRECLNVVQHVAKCARSTLYHAHTHTHAHAQVDFLIKPVRIEELRNMWQHVMRRRLEGESFGLDSSE